MRTKCGFWVVAMTLLSFLCVFNPHQAYAGSGSAAYDLDCSAGNAIDTAQAQNRQDWQKTLLNYAVAINTLFPVTPALSDCQKTLLTAMQVFPALADPLKIAQAIINPIIQSIISQVCSQVMSVINDVKQTLQNLTKICIPVPTFKLGQIGSFTAPSCNGGQSFNLITGFTPAGAAAASGGSAPLSSLSNPYQYQTH